MKTDYQDLLKPELVKSVSGLTLISRLIVDGYLSGLNTSRRVGSGMEFSQYRSYQPGDDLRLLDWKMLARSGRYYIKQSDIDTNISVKFILDSSNSMLHQEKGLSKMDYARIVIASLSDLAQHQGDAVGLFALNDQKLHSVYPKVQKQHFNRLLSELIAIETKGKWPEDSNNTRNIYNRDRKELVFFITDLYEHSQELTQFIKQLKKPRNEVVVLHIMGEKELEFDYKGNVTFEDLETGIKLKINAKEAKKSYLKSLENMMVETQNFLLTNNINYHLFKLDDPIQNTLQLFLKKRIKLI